MQDLVIFAGSLLGSGTLMLIGWWRINCAVAAENLTVFEEWEGYVD